MVAKKTTKKAVAKKAPTKKAFTPTVHKLTAFELHKIRTEQGFHDVRKDVALVKRCVIWLAVLGFISIIVAGISYFI